MTHQFENKTALITGGSRGLGAELVRQFARSGARTWFTFSKDDASANALVAELHDRDVTAIQADVAHYGKAHEVVREIVARTGRLDHLVCNAGFSRSGAIWKTTEEDWDAVVSVVLKGAFNYLSAAAPQFMLQKYGKVVFIGSINGLRGRIGSIGYNAAKAGLTGLAKTAAAELGAYGVNVNVVAPGFIETASQANTPELIRDIVIKECAIKRLGQPEDVANVVLFLCDDSARHVTGQIVKVDAGQYL
ncbi:MAG TPA: SDR family NAD(P)-dependent oxidoreductase [Thermoanaerobaculia bacterium]|nr:SDR family NAD(P)-dependent oxidoreductase [Thermoanaerobaculia bacterium]